MHHTSSRAVLVSVVTGICIAVVALIVGVTIMGRRRGFSGVGGETIVRCRDGHLFTTVWIPGISFKAVRWGWLRFQRCPVGNHWAWITPANASELTEEERRFAAAHHDSHLP